MDLFSALGNDPSAGINPDAAYDCGKPTGPIWKVSWAGLADKWPNAANTIKSFNISNEDMGAMVADVDLNGKTVEDTVSAWMEANADTWSGWIAK